jgi:hypothetical protein
VITSLGLARETNCGTACDRSSRMRPFPTPTLMRFMSYTPTNHIRQKSFETRLLSPSSHVLQCQSAKGMPHYLLLQTTALAQLVWIIPYHGPHHVCDGSATGLAEKCCRRMLNSFTASLTPKSTVAPKKAPCALVRDLQQRPGVAYNSVLDLPEPKLSESNHPSKPLALLSEHSNTFKLLSGAPGWRGSLLGCSLL